jgi:hypothetical protein
MALAKILSNPIYTRKKVEPTQTSEKKETPEPEE